MLDTVALTIQSTSHAVIRCMGWLLEGRLALGMLMVPWGFYRAFVKK